VGRFFLGVLLVALSLFGCGKSNDNHSEPANNPSQKPIAQNLSGQSIQDVIQTKYTKVLFTCELWVQRGAELVKSNPPSDKLTWDLLKDFSIEKSFELKGDVQDHTMRMNVNVRSVEIYGSVHHTTADGIVYKMAHTPVIKMDFAYETDTVYAPGVSSHGSGFQKRDIHEKIMDMSLNHSFSSDAAAGTFFHYLECTIDTEIKPEYKDHFSIEKRP